MAGQLIKRNDRTWLVRVYLGREDGKRKYLNKTVHGPKKDAQRVLNDLLRRKDVGLLAEPSRVTLDAYLDHWLETAAKPRVRGRTYRDYAGMLARYVRPALGRRRLLDLSPIEIQALYGGMLERGLSARTVRYTHAILRNALGQAVRWRMAAHNPAEYVDLPRHEAKEMRALSGSEVRRFLSVAEESPWRVLFNLLVTTGLRPGEAFGLQWRDLDAAAGTLTVQRTVTRGADGEVCFEQPKTPKSRRRLPLPAGLIALLLEHRDYQQLSEMPNPHDLLFPTADGALMYPNNFPKRDFKAVLKRAGLSEDVRLYDLRHTCATLLLQADVHPKVVSERLGHASVTLTLDTYSHVLPSMQREASDRLERLLYQDQEKGEEVTLFPI